MTYRELPDGERRRDKLDEYISEQCTEIQTSPGKLQESRLQRSGTRYRAEVINRSLTEAENASSL